MIQSLSLRLELLYTTLVFNGHGQLALDSDSWCPDLVQSIAILHQTDYPAVDMGR
jgi:hypothetical protein